MGIVGINGVELPTVPTVGNTLIVGTAAAELTPRLPISVDPIGIPVRAPPPGVVGDVDAGVDDEAILLEPEPHIPDRPTFRASPRLSTFPMSLTFPTRSTFPTSPRWQAPPIQRPCRRRRSSRWIRTLTMAKSPRSSMSCRLLGIAMVPVTVGAGLTPGDAISVEPRGMPVWDTAEPVPKPSGEVAPIVGVGLAIPLTCCAVAALQDDQRWKDRRDQRESHCHSPFENRAAAADSCVDRF